ncbi:MAG: metallophosphoesterase [Phycisphaerales bacterium]
MEPPIAAPPVDPAAAVVTRLPEITPLSREPREFTVAAEILGRIKQRCDARRAKDADLPLFPADGIPPWVKPFFEPYKRVLIDRAPAGKPEGLHQAWFVGDVHGDLVGLVAAFEVIRAQADYSKDDPIILLGDLIDDLSESEQVLAEVADQLNAGSLVLLLVGNHDDALRRTANGGFEANIEPRDYCDFLRRQGDEASCGRSSRLAESFISFIKHAPVALFLSDGTVVAHGGVPHTDQHEILASKGWCESESLYDDFIWARLAARATRRIAVSGSRSQRELGAADFWAFAEVVGKSLHYTPQRMIRGHDHVDGRVEIFGGPWRGAVLTVNNMSWKLPREMGEEGPRDPCIVRWTRGEPLQPILIKLDDQWRREMHLPPGA